MFNRRRSLGSLTPVTISNTANATNTTSTGTTKTFSSQSLGTADSTRVIAVGISVGWNGSVSTIDSVTIGGVSATQQVEEESVNGGAENFRAEIWAAAVPTGTTGDIVVTLSAAIGNNRGCTISVNRLVGTGVVTADDTAVNESQTAATIAVDVDTQADGALICATSCASGSESYESATEVYSGVNVTHRYSHTTDATTLTESPRSEDITFTSSTTMCAVSATWYPK